MSETKSAKRSVKHDRERNCGSETAIAVIFIVIAQG